MTDCRQAPSPYLAGPPFTSKRGFGSFVERPEIIDEVAQMFRHPVENAILIEGQRRIGKTSILHRIQQSLYLQDRSVLFSFGNRSTDTGFTEVLLDLHRAIVATSRESSSSSRRDHSSPEHLTTQLVELLNRISQSRNGQSPFVLLFDELDALGASDTRSDKVDPYHFLGLIVRECPTTKFVFVRAFEPLTNRKQANGLLKDMRCLVLGYLAPTEVASLCRLSDDLSGPCRLRWSQEAVDKVYELTDGHPLLAQAVCNVVWKKLTQAESLRNVQSQDVEGEDSQKSVLEQMKNSMEAVWDQFAAGEKAVLLLVAERGGVFPEQGLETAMLSYGAMYPLLREAYQRLRATRVLVQAAPEELRVSPPLMCRWTQLQGFSPNDEIQKIIPTSEVHYQQARECYLRGDVEKAEQNARDAVKYNPSHLEARRLLGRIQVDQGKLAEGIQIFEEVYQQSKVSFDGRELAGYLLRHAQQLDPDRRLEIYQRILSSLDPQNQDADLNRKRIEADRLCHAAQEAKNADNWRLTVECYTKATDLLPDDEGLKAELERCGVEWQLTENFDAAYHHLADGKFREARPLLGQVISQRPEYRRRGSFAAELLVKAIQIEEFDKYTREIALESVCQLELIVPLVGPPGGLRRVAISPAGDRIISADANGRIMLRSKMSHFWEARLIGEIRGDITALTFRPPYGDVIAACSSEQGVAIWDIGEDTQRLVAQWQGEHPLTSLVYAPLRHSMYIGDDIGKVIELQFKGSGTKLHANPFYQFQQEERISSLVISGDGKYLAMGGAQGSVWLIPVNMPEGRRSLDGFSKDGYAVHALAFSPDGLRLVGAGEESRICIWNIKTGQKERQLFGDEIEQRQPNPSTVLCLAFLRNGLLVSGAADSRLRIWNVRGEELAQRDVKGKRIQGLSVSPDDKLIITATEDAQLRIWGVLDRSGM